MSSFETLPIELRIMILKSLFSFEDLYNCIKTSKALYEAYRALERLLVLITQLEKSILPDALPYALTIQEITQLGTVAEPHTAQRILLSHALRKNVVFPFHLVSYSLASLTAMLQRHHRLVKFVKHFASSALSSTKAVHERKCILPYWATASHDQQEDSQIREINTSLSLTEMARLQRAFYAHEFHCQVVPVDTTRSNGSLLTIDQQCAWFFDLIPAYQREEIATVHQYYISMAGVLFDEMEDELVDDVKRLSSAISDSSAPPDTISGPALQQQMSRLELEYETSLWDGEDSFYLQPYSRHHNFGQCAQQEASLLASRGAEYFENVLSARKELRVQFLRENLGQARAFVPCAMRRIGLKMRKRIWVNPEWEYIRLREDTDYSSEESDSSDLENDDYLSTESDSSDPKESGWIEFVSVRAANDCPRACPYKDITRQQLEIYPRAAIRAYKREDYLDILIAGLLEYGKGWHLHTIPIKRFRHRYRRSRALGYVFWDAQRSTLSISTIREETDQNPSADNRDCWPRRTKGADSRLKAVKVNANVKAKMIEKYCSTALLDSWQ